MAKHFKIKESEKVELKRSLAERQEILETISAFSNTSGGTIYIGVDPSGEIVGVSIGARTLENLANEIKQNTDPKVFPSLESLVMNDKEITKVTVPEYPTKPVWAGDKVFLRVGRSNQRATAERIRQLIQISQPFLWDEQIVSDARLSEMNSAQVKYFLRKAEEERGATFEGSRRLSHVLDKLHLTKEGKLTKAALLLFGKEPQGRCIQSEVRCARFIGTEPIDFADMKVLRGTIIEQVPEALNFIQRHISVAVKITGKPEREEIWEYPKEAVREAIVNAICHRNYEDTGNVQVRIFDDRLEVWSPGTLPPGITIQSLKGEHRSQPRNGLIAKCFYLIKYIEQWGTGTNRIVRLCKEEGLPEPQFAEKAASVVVTFKRAKKNIQTSKESKKMRLNETQKKIVEYLREHKYAKTSELQEYLGLSVQAIRSNLRSMSAILNWSGRSKTDPSGEYSLKNDVEIEAVSVKS
jgi:ATP-dependent DNA helicase RecG